MADWEFPGLGFDPLPGNPQVAGDLQNDARIFGQRMADQAVELRKLAWRDGWQGEAAEVFSQHLKTLPLDLERCGEAFTGLADALTSYASAFDVAKRTTVADMERRAVETRQKMQAADTVFHTPVISAPGDCPPPPDTNPSTTPRTNSAPSCARPTASPTGSTTAPRSSTSNTSSATP